MEQWWLYWYEFNFVRANRSRRSLRHKVPVQRYFESSFLHQADFVCTDGLFANGKVLSDLIAGFSASK